MRMAFDFDLTITRDPEYFLEMMRKARDRGHEVMIVTGRHEHEPLPPLYQEFPIYYTGRKAKKRFMEFRGIVIDVWCDDDPLRILQDHESLSFD